AKCGGNPLQRQCAVPCCLTAVIARIPVVLRVLGSVWSAFEKCAIWAPTWAMSVGALLLTAATTSNAHATLIVKSVLFGSALSCWAWSAWSRRQKRPLTVQ